MLRSPIVICLLLISIAVHSQTRKDSIETAGKIAEWLALDFSVAERDSLIESLKDYRQVYETMHKLNIQNATPFPFAYVPAPLDAKAPLAASSMPIVLNKNVVLPKNKNELAFYSVAHLSQLIRTKKISSVELTRFFIERLKKYDDTLNCVISFTEEIAMQQAAKADEEIRKGIYRGPLHGIPYGIKDLFAVRGTKTTWGSTPYKDQVVDEDAFVYKKLRDAGAVLCAKLSLGALAYNDLWFGGRTNNPWDLKTGSSGSSAGSAAATAAGLLPFAIGTETWGSIVSPATTCGVTGLRPTFGSVSRSGAMVLCWSLDKVGPLCRTAEDAAIIFDAIKGADGNDPSSLERPFNYQPQKKPGQLRIAYAKNYFDNLSKDRLEWQVLETYRKLGADLKAVEFPDSAIYTADIMNIVLGAEASAAFEELTLSNRDDLIERQDKNFWPNIFRSARFIPAAEYINANRHRSVLAEALNKFMKQYDVVIVPSYAGNQLAMTNLTGHPAICFPIGFSKAGRPQSITLVGNLYDEASIISAAKAYQDATDHHLKRPPFFQN